MTEKFLSLGILLCFLNSCSPLYMVYVQNNTQKPVEIFVELKDEKFTKKYRKEFEKQDMFFYKKVDNIAELSLNPLIENIYDKEISSKKYNFTSDLNYNFILKSNLITNIDPNNGISIYPFEKIYYVQNEQKCFIVPKNDNQNCNFKTTIKQKIRKNQRTKRFADFIEIEN